MGKKYFIVGTFFGVQLRIDYSWFIIFGLIAWTVITSYLPSYRHDLSPIETTLAGLVVTILFFISVIAHEYAHSIVANRHGLKIKRITLFVFGGASELQHEPTSAKTELLMAAAGPLTSLAAAGLFAALGSLASMLNVGAIVIICQPLAALNLIVAIFNLLPAFPLDGGRILRSVLWLIHKDFTAASKNAANIGVFFSYLMIAIGILEIFAGYLISGLWFAIIGFFLGQSARFSYSQILYHNILAGIKIKRVLNNRFAAVPEQTTIQELLSDYVLRFKQYDFVVADSSGSKPIGIIELDRATRIGLADPSAPISQLMRPITPDLILKPEDPAENALLLMQTHNLDILPVVSRRKLIGVVMRRYLEDYVTIHRLQERHL